MGDISFNEAFNFFKKEKEKYHILTFSFNVLSEKYNEKLINSWILSVLDYNFIIDLLTEWKENPPSKEILNSFKSVLNYKYKREIERYKIKIEDDIIKRLLIEYEKKKFSLEEIKIMLELFNWFGLDKNLNNENYEKILKL
jgi:hypothetical protein